MSLISKRIAHVLVSALTVVTALFGSVAPSAAGLPDCAPTVTTEGEYTVLRFSSTGDCNWTVPADATDVEYIVVGAGGGGGAGGARAASCNLNGTPAGLPRFGGGGAGGAGGDVITGSQSVLAGSVISISVGAGGTGGTILPCPLGDVGKAGLAGTNGGQSAFDAEIAIGGGAGDGAPDTGAGAANGGTLGALFTGGNQPLSANDCNFDTTTSCMAAPGGAGAGENGFDPAMPDGQTDLIWTNGGAGGSGVEVAGVFYGGGGGGATRHCSSYPQGTTRHGGLGGQGGGGNGALIGCPTLGGANGDDGVDGLGGGGGGGRGNGATAATVVNNGNGGAGGDGIVIVKYIPFVNDPVVNGAVSNVTKQTAKLDWTVTDGGSVTEYKIKVDGVLIQTLTAPLSTYELINLRANKQYVIEIIPVINGTDYTAFITSFHTPAVKRLFVNFEPFRYRLQASQLAKIEAAFSAIPVGSTDISVTITGHVKKLGKGITATDRKLVAGRAKVVRWAFTKLGLNATFTVKSDLSKSVAFNYGRRADIVITYTPPVVNN